MSIRLHHVKRIEYSNEHYGNAYNLPMSLQELFQEDLAEYEVHIMADELGKWLDEHKDYHDEQLLKALEGAVAHAKETGDDTITFHNF